jgi:hypothetical protein
MKFGKFLLAAAIAAIFPLATGLGADATNSAAQAWAALTNFSLPTMPMEWQTNPPTEAQLTKFDDQQAALAGALPTGRGIFTRGFPATQTRSGRA